MPRNVTINLSNGTTHTYRNVPDSVTPDQIEQRAAKEFPNIRVVSISGGRKAASAQEQPGSAASFAKGALSGAANVILSPVEALINLGAKAGIPTMAEGAQKGRAGKARAEQALQQYRQAHPNYFAAGKLVGETVASAPLLSAAGSGVANVGGRIATAAPRTGKVVADVGRAIATGGIGSGRTAAQTAAMTRGARAADLATRVAGGAISGAGGAALSGGDVRDVAAGAAFGAGLPVAAGAARKVAGAVVDAFRGDKVRAAKMFREALGTDLDAAKAAFAALGPDDQRLARKVLVDQGIEPDTFMALGANVERLHPEQVRRLTEAETAAARRGLETAAGVAPGGTATDVRAAVRAGRKAVSEEMTPVREAAFERITDVNKAVSDAERLAQIARERADEITASGIVPRMRGLEGRSLEQLDAVFQNPEMFTTGRTVQRIGEIADQAGARADKAINQQLGLRQQALDMEDLVHQAAAADVGPQRGGPLVAALRQMAGQRGTRMDDLQRNTILRVAKKIEGAMDENGMIDPYDMYQLRKTGVSDIIEGFQKKITAGTEPRSGNLQRAEQLAGSVRSLIDKTLGPEFQDYLARSAQGYQAVNRQELAGEALKRFNAPQSAGYLNLVGNEEPKTVGKIMKGGPEQESILNAFAADPERWAALTNAADLLTSRNRMAELASSGALKASELMQTETPRKFRAAARVALSTLPAGRIAVEGAEQLAGDLMRPKIREQLAKGFLSGQNANELLNAYRTSMLTDEQISKLSPYTRNLLAQSLRNYFMPSSDPNAMAGY